MPQQVAQIEQDDRQQNLQRQHHDAGRGIRGTDAAHQGRDHGDRSEADTHRDPVAPDACAHLGGIAQGTAAFAHGKQLAVQPARHDDDEARAEDRLRHRVARPGQDADLAQSKDQGRQTQRGQHDLPQRQQERPDCAAAGMAAFHPVLQQRDPRPRPQQQEECHHEVDHRQWQRPPQRARRQVVVDPGRGSGRDTADCSAGTIQRIRPVRGVQRRRPPRGQARRLPRTQLAVDFGDQAVGAGIGLACEDSRGTQFVKLGGQSRTPRGDGGLIGGSLGQGAKRLELGLYRRNPPGIHVAKRLEPVPPREQRLSRPGQRKGRAVAGGQQRLCRLNAGLPVVQFRHRRRECCLRRIERLGVGRRVLLRC